MGKIKKILENELVGGTQSTDVYPVTSTKAVYDTNNKVLDDYIQHLKKTSTFAGIATPTTNPGTPDGSVFYIAGEGTYANFSNIVIEAGQLGILKWNGTWSKEVLEIGAGGGSGSGSGVSLGTLLAQLNAENPLPSANGQALTYNGSNFVWKIPTGSGGGSGSGGSTTGTLYFGASNKNLGFNGSNDMSLAFGDGLKVEKLDNQITVSAIGGGIGGGSIQVTDVSDSGESNNWISAAKLRFRSVSGTKPTIREIPSEGYVDVGIPTGGGSGSSSTNAGKLYFYKDGSEEYWNGESNFKIVFGSGLNVTWDSHSQITLSAIGGSGGSTSTSVSWTDVTGKPSTFTPSSHTHPTSEITGLSNYVQGVKVNNASASDRLANAVTLWGNNFSGNNSIGTASSYADLQYVKNIYAGNVFDIKAGNNSLLKVDNNPNIYVGFDYKANTNASILLFGNKTTIYTSGDDYRYDFKSNVFDVNSNQIHFGSETNGGRISWDAANNAFKIEGNVYATGGITALGVSNNATTSNNVDFTFRNVTANTFNVMDSIQLSNGLKLKRNAGNFDLVSTDGNINSFYFDGNAENYYLNTNGEAFFSNLDCESLSFNGVQNFKIVDAGSTTFTIQFECNSKTYQFTPSGGSVIVS